MVKILRSAAAMASLALSMPMINVAQAEELCSITPTSYATAKTDHPDLAFALSAVEEYSIAAWYTDRLSTTDRTKMIHDLTTKCSEDSRMTIVVYGIPNKDCNAGYSSGGTVSNTADYKDFLSGLTTAVGNRKVLYVVEPDAVGLLAEEGGCGSRSGYLDNLKVAVKALSVNANAELYVDVGYWTLASDSQRSKVVAAVKELAAAGTIKGITLNTSNYRSTSQLSELCTNFQTAMGSTKLSCIADTSRNYVEPTTTDWCNVLTAGIGAPPTSETNVSNLDYFMWIKPPGESDGTCNGGPTAGAFYETGFQKLWDQGYFVNKLGKNTIAEGGSGTTSQTTSSPIADKGASQATSSPTTDASASQTTDDSASQTSQQTQDDNASQATQDNDNTAGEADTTSSQITESSGSQVTQSGGSQVTESSESQDTESSASQITESGASQTTDTTTAPNATTAPTATTGPTATTAPTVTTPAPVSTPTETTDAPDVTTEAPASQTSNCKVKRRFRKL